MDGCYICQDPEFALMGMPLCRKCPACGGHVQADDTVCWQCGLDDQVFWTVVGLVVEGELSFDAGVKAIGNAFSTRDWKLIVPTDEQLVAAVAAFDREVLDNAKNQ